MYQILLSVLMMLKPNLETPWMQIERVSIKGIIVQELLPKSDIVLMGRTDFDNSKSCLWEGERS